MTALTKDRNTPRSEGDFRQGLAAAGAMIFAGALLMRNAAGHIVPGQTATGLVGVGRAEERIDNSGGAAGDLAVLYRPGIFLFENSAGGDEIATADIGSVCFAVDDQSVAKTDGSAARSPAGIVDAIDENGVWVRLDEALTQAS